MTLMEVLEQLNNGKTKAEVASMAGISVKDLERKLANAAIEFDQEENEYQYKGTASEDSLSRDIRSRIVVLSVDKPFVKKKQENRTQIKSEETFDMEYKLFKDYLQVDHSELNEKKTFFLTEEIYNTIKHLSAEKSFKMNGLVNVLLQKGLEYYKVDLLKKDS
ncbi:hypothetical protein [Ureibacillus thermosphaericus]|uniref:hypothetical protein n=1 Tax=Ureibacillus thermosphaericus TaxID=51173 RepID=UPI0030C96A3A